MSRKIVTAFAIVLSCLKSVDAEEPPSFEEIVQDSETLPGLFPLYWDESDGKMRLKIERWNEEFLYVSSLTAGLGSNDIGLDRNQLGATRVVRFERSGPKVLLVQSNYDYRAESDNAAERAAVSEAFAESVVWGFTVEAEDGEGVLVDASDFFMRDAHNVTQRLKRSDQGQYKLDASRTAFYLPRTKNFETNTEVEVTLTYTGDPEGVWVRSVSPDARSLTLRQHHTFAKLPDDGYEKREFDPRAGMHSISYFDYATPIGSPLEKRFVVRHRLQKKNPNEPISDPVEPIVYYLDPGTPEPVRSALIEGASWWNQAFEAIGYRDAFQVKVLPEGADPMDLQYNMINWVHRATRGWSYGSSVVDPRTGEIIKGHVTLGSLRVRQDYLIAQGLLSPFDDASTRVPEVEALALARLRQLSAHEVGHTIGFAHNYVSSAANRSSVMDYPHPKVTIDPDGSLNLANAYAVGIGDWDKVSVAYGYQHFPEGVDESAALTQTIVEAMENGLLFLSDQDARPSGSAHPEAHLWDNGSSAAEGLLQTLAVRTLALQRFSEAAIPAGTPMAGLEEVLVPLYFFHRYQVEAAAKVIGGLRYTYALRGDGQIATELIDVEAQRNALDALMQTLDPAMLALPNQILSLIPPRSYGMQRHRELFAGLTNPTLDPVAIAQTSADWTLSLLLHPARLTRVQQHHAQTDTQPSLVSLFNRLTAEVWASPQRLGLEGEIQYTLRYTLLKHFMSLAADPAASTQVRAMSADYVKRAPRLFPRARTAEDTAQRMFVVDLVTRFHENPEEFILARPQRMPPGSPIGMGSAQECEW